MMFHQAREYEEKQLESCFSSQLCKELVENFNETEVRYVPERAMWALHSCLQFGQWNGHTLQAAAVGILYDWDSDQP